MARRAANKTRSKKKGKNRPARLGAATKPSRARRERPQGFAYIVQVGENPKKATKKQRKKTKAAGKPAYVMTIIHPDGVEETEFLSAKPDLQKLQRSVGGGLIERVPIPLPRGTEAYVNEDGRGLRMPPNKPGMLAVGWPKDAYYELLGPVVIVKKAKKTAKRNPDTEEKPEPQASGRRAKAIMRSFMKL